VRALAALLALFSLAGPAAAQSYLVVVTGLSGEPHYAHAFHEWATTLIDAAEARWGVPESNVVYLAEKVETDPKRIAARSTRENVESTLMDVAARAAPDDQIFVVLIGHGATRGGESRFNLPGPDMTPADFDAALDGFTTQKIVFVNAASASGEFIAPLSAQNRAIITATRSGNESNQTVFAAYFTQAFAGDGADVDKDERVSALEAFNYARREVARVYEADGRLLTEHALLDDNGDGEGSGELDPLAADGRLARTLFLSGGTGAVASGAVPSDPRLAVLYQERRQLEERVAALRTRKDEMDPEDYERELEELLVELALKTREIRELEEKGQ
jgi:hypothetical protein